MARFAPSTLATVELLVAAVILGSGTPVAHLVARDLPLHLGSTVRMAAAVAVLAPVLWWRRAHLAGLPPRVHGVAALIALLGMYVFTLALVQALDLTSSALCSVVLGAAPAVTALGAVLLLRETLGVRGLAGVGLATAGVVVAQLDPGALGAPPLAVVALLAVALVGLAAWTLLGKLVADRVEPAVLTALVAVYTLPLFAIPALVGLEPALPPRSAWEGWAWAAWWGAGETALGTLLWYRALARAPATLAAVFTGAVAVSAVALSWVLLGEPVLTRHLAGLALVLAGVALATWPHAPPLAPPQRSTA